MEIVRLCDFYVSAVREMNAALLTNAADDCRHIIACQRAQGPGAKRYAIGLIIDQLDVPLQCWARSDYAG